MFKPLITCFGISLIAVCSLDAVQARLAGPPQAIQQPGSRQPSSELASADVSSRRTLLTRYCVTCHNERLQTAGLALDTLLDEFDVTGVRDAVDAWEHVVAKLRSGAMPPTGRRRPDSAEYDALAAGLETALDRFAAANPNPGRAPIHRLNRAEYASAIRDLLAVDIDSRLLLPADNSGYGFDNIAAVLSMSPVLLERYMIAAQKITRLALGDPSIRPVTETYQVPFTLRQDDRMDERLPFGSRGGIAISHLFPLDGEYVLKIALQRVYGDHIKGLDAPNDIEVRLDRERIKQFTVGGDGPLNPWAAVSNPSEYELTADKDLTISIQVKAGRRLVGVSFLKKSAIPEGVLEARSGVFSFAFARDRFESMAIDTVQISGPYQAHAPEDTPSRRRVFVCYPATAQDEASCAREVLSTLARRAYRRPVTDADLTPLLQVYDTGRDQGGFETGIALALRSILVDPEFLFRIERDPPGVAAGTAYRLSDVELASRLSFFLWSSIPDDELLDLAATGELRNSTILQQQVSRMLRDARSNALVGNFAGQWLLLRNMRLVVPDINVFPDFDDNLRESMLRETALFVESQLRDDRPLADLLSANYSFLNERLARHYGIPNIYGSHFRRVTLPDDTRGGLLGQGSILTVTSYPHRTAPTLRGLWVLDNLLGVPPPVPPPDVPELPEPDENGTILTMRERMVQHRENPVCASCHARMDPLGFALEQFDGIGGWRAAEGKTPIDASGRLPDGSGFEGPAGLRAVLLSRHERFVEVVSRKLLTYALGRGLESYDAPIIRQIVREAEPSQHRWSSVILGIVNSSAFQMRMSREPS